MSQTIQRPISRDFAVWVLFKQAEALDVLRDPNSGPGLIKLAHAALNVFPAPAWPS